MTELEIARHNALIDPVLHFWSWEVPVYLFLGGLAAGVMIATAALALRRDPDAPVSRALRLAPLAVPVALSIGMLALFLDLEHKLYVWRFYLAFQPTSPMSWGSWVLLAVYPASLLLALATAPPTWSRRSRPRFRRSPTSARGPPRTWHRSRRPT